MHTRRRRCVDLYRETRDTVPQGILKRPLHTPCEGCFNTAVFRFSPAQLGAAAIVSARVQFSNRVRLSTTSLKTNAQYARLLLMRSLKWVDPLALLRRSACRGRSTAIRHMNAINSIPHGEERTADLGEVCLPCPRRCSGISNPVCV